MTAISVVVPDQPGQLPRGVEAGETGLDNDHAVLVYRDDWQVALLPDRE